VIEVALGEPALPDADEVLGAEAELVCPSRQGERKV
jgi:hypothetical protein